MPTKPPAPAPTPETEPARKPVDKLPAGSVRVGLDTVVLTEERANSLYFVQTGSDDFGDRRKVAAEARNAVVQIVKAALSSAKDRIGPLDLAVAKLRNHRFEAELRAARAEREKLDAKVRELENRPMANEQPSPLAVEPEGGAGGRLSAAGEEG